MDHKSIALYFNRKGWMARVIHDDLVVTLGEEAIAYSTVTKYLREAQTGPDDATALLEEISPHIDDWDEAILRALEEFSFSSVQHLSVQYIYPKPWYIGDSQRSSDSWRVISAACHRSCLAIRRQDRSNVPGPFERYCWDRSPEPGTTS
jgi:hypothetical protein